MFERYISRLDLQPQSENYETASQIEMATVRISNNMCYIRFESFFIIVNTVVAVRPLKFWGEILLVHENILYIYYIYIYIYNFHDVICSFITANHDVIRVLSIFWYQSPGRKTKARTPERRQLLTLDQKCDVAKSMHKQMTEDLKRAKDISERELDNYKVISQERERESKLMRLL